MFVDSLKMAVRCRNMTEWYHELCFMTVFYCVLLSAFVCRYIELQYETSRRMRRLWILKSRTAVLQSIYICHVEEICRCRRRLLSAFRRKRFMNENRRWPRPVFPQWTLLLCRPGKEKWIRPQPLHAMCSAVNGSNVARGKVCGQESSPGPRLAPPLCYVHHNT